VLRTATHLLDTRRQPLALRPGDGRPHVLLEEAVGELEHDVQGPCALSAAAAAAAAAANGRHRHRLPRHLRLRLHCLHRAAHPVENQVGDGHAVHGGEQPEAEQPVEHGGQQVGVVAVCADGVGGQEEAEGEGRADLGPHLRGGGGSG
jgi:hypothetical protein